MEALFEFISATGDGVFAVDGQQRIVLWNDGAVALLGYAAEEVLGHRCFRVIAGLDGQGCDICQPGCRVIRDARRGRRVENADVRVHDRDGRERWLNFTTLLVPSAWKELSLLVHLFRDVPHSHEIERVPPAILGADVTPDLASDRMPDATEQETGKLTGREREVLRQLAAGASTDAIARKLFISPTTVRNHIQNILEHLGVHSRLEAVTYSLREGLL